MQKLQQILNGFRTNNNRGMKVFVHYQKDGVKGQLQLGNAWRVNPCDELMDQLTTLLGQDNVRFDYVAVPEPA